jgi:hypothetical protein
MSEPEVFGSTLRKTGTTTLELFKKRPYNHPGWDS